MPSTFQDDVRLLLRQHGIDAVTKLPDYILAAYLQQALDALTTLLAEQARWESPALHQPDSSVC